MGLIVDRIRAQARTGEVREITAPDGKTEYVIPKYQRNIHVTFEALAVFAAAPALFYIAATNKQLPTWQKAALYGIGGASLVVDGWLLIQYARQRKNGVV